MKPYLIRTPPIDPTSGGIRVMYGLYGWLLAKGQIAYLNAQIDVPSVGIYPEIYHGNEMNSQRVIRYILQRPAVMSTSGIPGPSREEIDATTDKDDIHVFSRVYDQWGVDDDHILFLPIIDLHTFKDQHKKRTKTAFYCARGKNKSKHPIDAIEITRETARDQQKLADLLNECETIYIYDRITAMLEVARLCGTKVVYWGEDSLETLQKYEPGLNGVGYQEEVKLYTQAFRDHYEVMRLTFEERLDRFIDRTQL